MQDLISYTFDSTPIRVITHQDGTPWFVLRDLLDAMDSKTTTSNALESIKQGLGDGYSNEIPILDSLKREQRVLIVHESAATYLLSRSNTDKGRELNRFLHVEVLPSIRKTGSYTVDQEAPKKARTQRQPTLPQAVRAMLMLGNAALNVPGVNKALALATTYDLIERTTGIEASYLRKALPSIPQESNATLNATEIGRQLGVTAIKANVILASAGLITKVNDEWTLTEEGEKHGELRPYSRNGHAAYQILWKPSVVEIAQGFIERH